MIAIRSLLNTVYELDYRKVSNQTSVTGFEVKNNFSTSKTITYPDLHIFWSIGVVGRVFTNGPGAWSSIPGRVIPKTQKMVLNATLLNTQYYKVRIKGKWSNPGKGITSNPKNLSSSCWKEGLRVALDYGPHLTYCLYIYIYEYWLRNNLRLTQDY